MKDCFIIYVSAAPKRKNLSRLLDYHAIAAETNFSQPRCRMNPSIALENRYSARNYDPLPVVLQRRQGVWLWDTEGKRYLDMMTAYSAVSFGHGHPVLLAALTDQAQRLAVTSRAYHTDQLGPFLQLLC